MVLQKRFWELKVTDEGFSVGLSFNDVPCDARHPVCRDYRRSSIRR